MSAIHSYFQNRHRLISWLGGTLLGYSLLGFLLLPWLVESQLEQFLDERLAVTTEIESVYFNPFSFYFQIDRLRLQDAAQGTLLNLGELRLNFQASRLALLKLQFSEIHIADLDIYYARDSLQSDTISRLSERWLNTAAAEAANSTAAAGDEENGDLIPLQVLSLTLSNINTHIVDSVPTTPFATTLTLAQARIDNFSTLPDQSGNNLLSIELEEDARLQWSGDFSVNPLSFRGEIALSRFSLLPVSRYLQDTLPFQLDQGRVNLSFDYDIDLATEQAKIRIDDIALAVNEVSATQQGESEPFIEAATVSITGGQISIPENLAQFEALALREVHIAAIRDESGLIDLVGIVDAMLPAAATTADTIAEETDELNAIPAEPWLFTLAAIAIENNRFSFLDTSLETPFEFATSINLDVSGIDNRDGTRFPLAASLSPDSGGELALAGELQFLPTLELESSLNLNNIAIDVIQPYVNEYAFLELESGTLNLDASIGANETEPFSFAGGVSLDDVEILDLQLNETLFSISHLGIDAMSLSLAANNVDISEVSLEDLFARVLIHEDGSSNISRSIKPSSDPATTAPQSNEEAEASPALAIIVGRVSLLDASASFTDRNLPLPFDANIHDLAGSVQGFASNSNQATTINLEGQVDEFGLVQIVSSLNPFNLSAQSQIDVNFSNIDMPSLTPYVIKFAGREIAEGRVDVDLSYRLQDGELDANNQLVLRALRLGERVEQEGAMDLPLDLALALLKDGNGVIDLEVPVVGNVNDPEFDFGPAIRRAISNILGNLVAAPFRLLASLVGGGDADSLEQIRFQPGRADIAPPEREVLLQLGEALRMRPQLILEIPAISATADELALQTIAVDAEIDSIIEAQAESIDSLTVRRLNVVESLYVDVGASPSLEEIRQQHIPNAAVAVEDSGATTQAAMPAQLDTLAYIADLRDRLIAARPIDDADLAALATARRDAVVDFLTVQGGISAPRLLPVEPLIDAEEEDGWLILPFGLTTQ